MTTKPTNDEAGRLEAESLRETVAKLKRENASLQATLSLFIPVAIGLIDATAIVTGNVSFINWKHIATGLHPEAVDSLLLFTDYLRGYRAGQREE